MKSFENQVAAITGAGSGTAQGLQPLSRHSQTEVAL